ncbi:LmbU family transcriptional regulator [Streptomyces sp. RK9]|uniref:LmbU family transcriptional regulator n=1 Tax=Streptomyces sp. RK9 TaxID=3239284 RepID=UPI00386AD1A1
MPNLRHPTPNISGPQEKLTVDDRARTRRSSLSLPDYLPLEHWKTIGEQIFAIVDSSAWWLGDWLVFGQQTYPRRYRDAIEQTSLDYQTLRNYAWIARKFPPSRRRDGLSLQHHAEVAALPAPAQDHWLSLAEAHGWSRNELRRHLRAARTEPQDAGATEDVQVTASAEQCDRWEKAAQHMESDLNDWMIRKVDEAAATALGPEIADDAARSPHPDSSVASE